MGGGEISLLTGAILSTIMAYASFTPLHDAAHRSVGRCRWISAVVGRAAGIPLMAPFPAFRMMHLAHHKHTNDPENDPDIWSGSGPRLLLPLRWITQDLHYYGIILRSWSTQSRSHRYEIVGVVALQAVLVTTAVTAGFGIEVLCLRLIPARIATGMLAFALDYLPPRPHKTRAREDRFRATHIIDNRLLTLPLMGHNYHLIHHLYPGAPFYRYGRIWNERKDMLKALGAQTTTLLGRHEALRRSDETSDESRQDSTRFARDAERPKKKGAGSHEGTRPG